MKLAVAFLAFTVGHGHRLRGQVREATQQQRAIGSIVSSPEFEAIADTVASYRSLKATKSSKSGLNGSKASKATKNSSKGAGGTENGKMDKLGKEKRGRSPIKNRSGPRVNGCSSKHIKSSKLASKALKTQRGSKRSSKCTMKGTYPVRSPSPKSPTFAPTTRPFPSNAPSDLSSDSPSSFPSVVPSNYAKQTTLEACRCDSNGTCVFGSLERTATLTFCIFADDLSIFYSIESLILVQGSMHQVVIEQGESNSAIAIHNCTGSSFCAIETNVSSGFFKESESSISGMGTAMVIPANSLHSTSVLSFELMNYQASIVLAGAGMMTGLDIGTESTLPDDEAKGDGGIPIFAWLIPILVILVILVVGFYLMTRRRRSFAPE